MNRIKHFRSFSTSISQLTKKKNISHSSHKQSDVNSSYKVTTSRGMINEIFPKLDYLLVLDFEATCEADSLILPCQEIIEMPVIALDTETWEEKAKFHQYITPTERPILTSFCTQLTGIIQEMIEGKPHINDALEMFHEWLKQENIIDSNFAFVTCGDWDLKVALPNEAKFKGITLPEYYSRWINVKKSHGQYTGQFAKSLSDLLSFYNIKHEGRLHSGIDDAKNIAAIVKALGFEGHKFRVNSGSSYKERLFKRSPAN
ncbi:unnamed protein product [Auanema sp. JU1783]|nr:unnamed protein product [Auanema sp. JU1783]